MPDKLDPEIVTIIEERIRTKKEVASQLAEIKVEEANIAAGKLLEVAAAEARRLISEATLKAKDLLAVAVTQAQQLIEREQSIARTLIENAAEEDRQDALAIAKLRAEE